MQEGEAVAVQSLIIELLLIIFTSIKVLRMELGISVIMFLGIGAVVMALFCLITRYFNKKLQRALED